jgi:hypothetical protein
MTSVTTCEPPADHVAPTSSRDRWDRWVMASQMAQHLGPAAWALGGFASAEIAVDLGDGSGPQRPAAAVVVGETPEGWVLRRPPLLVVELAPCPPPLRWLERGVPCVWVVGAGEAWVLTLGSTPRRLLPPSVLRVEGTGLQLPVGCSSRSARDVG